MWAGIAGNPIHNNTQIEIAISVHDSVYSTDFASATIPYYPNQPEKNAQTILSHVLDALRKFSTEHLCKFLGAGVTLSLLRDVRSLSPYFFNPPPNTHIIGAQFVYASLARYGYRSNRFQHQAFPYRFAHKAQHKTSHLIHHRILCSIRLRDSHRLR
jgi:hypothetical protein